MIKAYRATGELLPGELLPGERVGWIIRRRHRVRLTVIRPSPWTDVMALYVDDG